MSLTLALEWAALGHRVLPVNGKRPAIKAWQINCTTDPAIIHSMWAAHPNALVGIATGEPGYDVLDFDVAGDKPGLAQLEKLLDTGCLIPGTFMVVATPSGGRHLYFRGTDQRNKQNEKAIPGVDFRGVGGMVLAAGNPGYRWVSGRSIDYESLKQIDWLAIAACLAPEEDEPRRAPARQPTPASRPKSKLEAPPTRAFDNAPGEESPLDWYCRQHSFADVLFADGWQYAYTDTEGRACYTRPGKAIRDGISANVVLNGDGRETLINRSTTVGWLPTDRAMSIAQYMAYRDHGGDVRAAAGHIRKTMMPSRHLVSTGANQPGLAGTAAPPGAPVATEGTRSAELVPSAEAGPPEQVRDFWKARPELREMWYKAQIGGVSPWAVLGNALAQIAGRIGPHVVLPPLGGVGAPASLNLLVAISGNTGVGKGRSNSVAREFMGAPHPPQRKPGTGQGIAAMFTEQTQKEGPVQSNDTVVLNVAEITQLGAHMSQQGATITSTLLEVYMGEELGEHYANKELRRPVRDGAYRLALVAGIQPDNSHIVFDHAASGLPQRFVWLPAFWSDSVLPEGILEPPPPGSEQKRWRAWSGILPGSMDDTIEAAWSPTDVVDKKPKKDDNGPVAVPVKEPYLVQYAPSVAREIRTDHNRRLNLIKKRMLAGEDDAGDPDSHLVLTRVKVATLLAAWLDSRVYISDEMWDLARWVIWVSNDTRGKAQGRLSRKAQEKTAMRAAAHVATQQAVKADAIREHDALVIKVSDRIRVITAADWTVHKLISQGIAGRDKKSMRDANISLQDILDELVLTGAIEKREPEGAERGARYRARK